MSGPFDRLIPYVAQALGLSEDSLVRAYRPAHESEMSEILAFRRKVNGEMWWDDRKFVQWRYFSKTTDAGDAPYWACVRDGEILGACGLEPVTLVIGGTAVPAVRSLDIMVRPDLDGLGLGAFMNLVLFRHFPIILVTGSNARSHNLLERMFHHTTDLRFWKMVIRSRSVVDEKLKLVGPLAGPIAAGADLALAAGRSLRRVAPPAGITIRELEAFDSQAVDLSRRCELAGRVLVRRSDEYLNWRFVQNPRCRHRIVGAFDGDRLEGYVVTRFNLARPNPRREAEIVDWLAAPVVGRTQAVLPALIQAGVDALVRDGAEILSCAAATSDIESVVESVGFRFRPGERLPFYVKAADESVHERLSSGARWFLTRGDIDTE